jgi:hypothetical protein
LSASNGRKSSSMAPSRFIDSSDPERYERK